MHGSRPASRLVPRLAFRLSPAAATVAAACSTPSPAPDFTSAHPGDRARATLRAVDADDPASARRLVEMLESQDPALRMLAIGALERRTGETFGYRFEDPPLKRQAALDRWWEWAREQGGSLEYRGASPPPTESTSVPAPAP